MNTLTDKWIVGFDAALRTLAGVATSSRQSPGQQVSDTEMSKSDRRHGAALMRVNHVGEICAQALYQAQAQHAHGAQLSEQFRNAAREEEDHLAWTAERIEQLGSHASVLNPLWFGGAYLLGMAAARMGDARSLGFVVETERQVEAHLNHHLESLPASDGKSRAIVSQMRSDEARHGAAAKALGAKEVPAPVRVAMRLISKVMTSTAYYL